MLIPVGLSEETPGSCSPAGGSQNVALPGFPLLLRQVITHARKSVHRNTGIIRKHGIFRNEMAVDCDNDNVQTFSVYSALFGEFRIQIIKFDSVNILEYTPVQNFFS